MDDVYDLRIGWLFLFSHLSILSITSFMLFESDIFGNWNFSFRIPPLMPCHSRDLLDSFFLGGFFWPGKFKLQYWVRKDFRILGFVKASRRYIASDGMYF